MNRENLKELHKLLSYITSITGDNYSCNIDQTSRIHVRAIQARSIIEYILDSEYSEYNFVPSDEEYADLMEFFE